MGTSKNSFFSSLRTERCTELAVIELVEMSKCEAIQITIYQWIASGYRPYNDEVVNPHNIRNSGLLPASCLAVRNDGGLYRHHSFLQGIFPLPAARNDVGSRFLEVP